MNSTMLRNAGHRHVTPIYPSAVERQRLSTPAPVTAGSTKTSTAQKPPSEIFLNGRKIGLHVELWLISEIDRRRYSAVFRKLTRNGARVSGGQVRDYFQRFNLPQHVLRDIWEVADEQHEGELNEEHFSVALHLLERVLRYSSTSSSAAAVVKPQPMSSAPTYKPPIHYQKVQHVAHANSKLITASVAVQPPVVPNAPKLQQISPPKPIQQTFSLGTIELLPKTAVVPKKLAATPKYSVSNADNSDRRPFSDPHLKRDALAAPASSLKLPSSPLWMVNNYAVPSADVASSLPSDAVVPLLSLSSVFTQPSMHTGEHNEALFERSTSISGGAVNNKFATQSASNTAEIERLRKELEEKRRLRQGLGRHVEKLSDRLRHHTNASVTDQQTAQLDVTQHHDSIVENKKACDQLQHATRSLQSEVEQLRRQRITLENRRQTLVVEKSSSLEQLRLLQTLNENANKSGSTSKVMQPNFEPILHAKREAVKSFRQQLVHIEPIMLQQRNKLLQFDHIFTAYQSATSQAKHQNHTLQIAYETKQHLLRDRLSLRRHRLHQLHAQQAEKQQQHAMLVRELSSNLYQAQQSTSAMANSTHSDNNNLTTFSCESPSASPLMPVKSQVNGSAMSFTNGTHNAIGNIKPYVPDLLGNNTNSSSNFLVPANQLMQRAVPQRLSTTSSSSSRSSQLRQSASPNNAVAASNIELENSTKNAVAPVVVRPAPPPPTAKAKSVSKLETDLTPQDIYDVPKSIISRLYSNVGENNTAVPAVKNLIAAASEVSGSVAGVTPAFYGSSPLLFVAVQNYGGAAADELTLHVGDLIQVMVLHQDKWWFGQLVSPNNNTAIRGYFPASAVQRVADTPIECTALYDFEARNEDEVSFRAGEHLAILTSTSTSSSLWALARPIITDEGAEVARAGLVPINYLSVISSNDALPHQDARNGEENDFDAYDREFDDDDDISSMHAYEVPSSTNRLVNNNIGLERVSKLVPERALAVDELLNTEKSYNTFLHAVIRRLDELFGDNNFNGTRGRQKAQSQRSVSVANYSSVTTTTIWPPDEHKIICGGWTHLARHSDALLRRWESGGNTLPQLHAISDAFMQMLPVMQSTYAEFCASHQVQAISIVHAKCAQNDAFDYAIKQFSAGAEDQNIVAGLRGCTLEAAFVRPLERITRYPLLLKRILSLTAPDDADFAMLSRAVNAAEAACVQINEGVGQRESVVRLQWLSAHVQRGISYRSERLDDFSSASTNTMGPRQLLFFGSLFKAQSGRELVAFLFNDFLLFTTPSESLCDTSVGPFSFDSKVWRQQQLKPYKLPIMLDRMRVRAADDATATIYEANESNACSNDAEFVPAGIANFLNKNHLDGKSSSLSRKPSQRRKSSFDNSMRNNATCSDLTAAGLPAESSGSAMDISSREHLNNSEFIVQSNDGLVVRLKALSQNECRNWVKALRQAAGRYRRANDTLNTRAAPAPIMSGQNRLTGRCRMQVVAAYGLSTSNAVADNRLSLKCMCMATISGTHTHKSHGVDANGGICRWNDTFSLPFTQDELDGSSSSSSDGGGNIVFNIFSCCIFRPDRLLGGCALKLQSLVEQCEAKRGPVTLRVPLILGAGDSALPSMPLCELEVKADVRLLASESQVMLGSELIPLDMVTNEGGATGSRKMSLGNHNNNFFTAAKRSSKERNSSYHKLMSSPAAGRRRSTVLA